MTPIEASSRLDMALLNGRAATNRRLPMFVVKENGCWEWSVLDRRTGYGALSLKHKKHRAHVFCYKLFVGPIGFGMVLDHLCRNKLCINPDHLEPVTPKVNTLRGTSFSAKNSIKTHCPKGHPLSGENLWVSTNGRRRRHCRECGRVHHRKWLAQQRVLVAAADAADKGNRHD